MSEIYTCGLREGPIILPDSDDPEVIVNALIDEGFTEAVARNAVDQAVKPKRR